MNEHMLKNYKRFMGYTKKLGIFCLVASVICLLLFPNDLYIGGILFIASISAFAHSAYLKISVFAYEKQQKK